MNNSFKILCKSTNLNQAENLLYSICDELEYAGDPAFGTATLDWAFNTLFVNQLSSVDINFNDDSLFQLKRDGMWDNNNAWFTAQVENKDEKRLTIQKVVKDECLFRKTEDDESLEKMEESVALFELGCKYRNGDGRVKCIKTAVELFERASRLGHVTSKTMLGDIYFHGHLGKADKKTAIEWYTQSAGHEDSYAQYILGHIFSNGWGVDKDFDKAVSWYKKAANNGWEEAVLRLNGMFGRPENYRGKDLQLDT